MYDYNGIQNDYMFYFVFGIFIFIFSLYRGFVKEPEYKVTCTIIGVCFLLFFGGVGVYDVIATKEPDVEIYIGEYVGEITAGVGAQKRTECIFDSHNNSHKKTFNIEDVKYFLTPEKGKWYEIYYVTNSSEQVPVKMVETRPPEYVEEIN